MQIPPSQLLWYAAFHDAGDHPHIHMMLWSDELKEVYVRKDIAYKGATEAARESMRRIVDRLESVENPPESIQQKLLELALELRTIIEKKQKELRAIKNALIQEAGV